MSPLRLLTISALLVGALLGAIPWSLGEAQVAHADGCVFVLGFSALHDLLPNQVGTCLDNEQHNPANGDGLQHTTGGLLVWRKTDNWTAFTDGYWTWIDGPAGLAARLNTQRFSWEANPDGLPRTDADVNPRCHTEELAVEEGGRGVAAGNVGVTLRMRSRAAAPCSLYGYPGAQLLDANRLPLATSVRWSQTGYLIGTVPKVRVVLIPGMVAYAALQYTDVQIQNLPCPPAAYLQVTPPDEFSSVVIPVHDLAPCAGLLSFSPILPYNPLAPSQPVNSKAELTAEDNGRTFTYGITSRVAIILDGMTYPKEQLTVVCQPDGALGPVSNLPSVAPPLYAVRYEGVQPGRCEVSDGNFHVTLVVP